jgi:DNA helicase-2/ATP-dependent DNA helicase PcrA
MDSLAALNARQLEAVTTPPGAVLVLAGPGSGKTRVLTHRAAYIVHSLGADPRDVMAVTFTNKAAREMTSRIIELIGGEGANASGMTLGTFHALCARILRREADRMPFTREFVIFDDTDQNTVMREIVKQLGLDPKQYSPTRMLDRISRAKNELIEVEAFASDTYFNEIVARAYQRYQEQLLINNALDFDDLLFWTVRLLKSHVDVRGMYRRRYQHILVDEFQDTNTAQYTLLTLLGGPQPDLFVVGDPDQSIYRWRGADYRNVHRFQEDYPRAQTILLEQNYRSTQTILDVAVASSSSPIVGQGSGSRCMKPMTKPTKRISWSNPSPCSREAAWSRAIALSCTAPTHNRANWRMPSCAPGCPTSSSAPSASMAGVRSRISSPTCA